MRLDTQVWIRLESKGRPAETKQINATVRDSIMILAQWLATTYMGSHIEIRIARSEADLHRSNRTSELKQLGDELDAMLAGADAAGDESTRDICLDSYCANKEVHELGSADCTSKEKNES